MSRVPALHLLDSPGRSERLRVLFDSPAAWPVLCPGVAGGIGGAELRAVTFARELARCGEFDVQMLVNADGVDPGLAKQPVVRDRLTVRWESRRTLTDSGASSRWLAARRFSDRLRGSLGKRLTGLPERHRGIETLDFDLLCCFGVTNRTASLVRSVRQLGRRVLVFLTSDRTLQDLKLHGRQRGLYGERGAACRFALKHADAVVVQKDSQQRCLRNTFAIPSQLIRNPIDLNPIETLPEGPQPPSGSYVLWVGRADTFSKRADVCWQLARLCPAVSFVAIMNRHASAVYQHLQATQPANVTLVQHVPPDRIERFYRHATLLVNTSDAEGFPNSFLQAGKYGVPIVSLNEDPDDMLQRHGGGICCHGSIRAMQRCVNDLAKRGTEYQRMSRSVRQYTHTFHGLAERGDELARLIRQTFAARNAA